MLRRLGGLILAGMCCGGCVFVDSPLSIVLSISPPTLTVTRYSTQPPAEGVPPPAVLPAPVPAIKPPPHEATEP